MKNNEKGGKSKAMWKKERKRKKLKDGGRKAKLCKRKEWMTEKKVGCKRGWGREYVKKGESKAKLCKSKK